MVELLFSYGTLQKPKVQLESFGRLLQGQTDQLPDFYLGQLEIKDEAVLATSEQLFHPIAVFSGNHQDIIEGMVFEITNAELQKADLYEVEDYERVLVNLVSGKKAWAYVKRN